ncbi:MAG: glycosyltransferase family 4 protein [Parcubacteria group bacterium]|nr:glycosyltransferase family 4 protein [Parcubacteria group bacterium]
MNILILKFPHNSALGGGELHTLQLFSALQQRDHKFYLASSCSVLLPEFIKRKWPVQKVWLGREPVSISGLIIFTLLSPYLCWRLFFLLLKYKTKYKTDKLYCLSLTEKLLATVPAKLLGYSVYWMEHLRIERWLRQNPYRFLYVWLSNLTTTITVSQAVKRQLVDLGLKDKNVTVIYNGIDTGKFKPDPLPSTRYSQLPTIGTVCRLCPEKGVDYLIKAFQQVVKQNPEVELQIAGEGPEKENLQKLASELGLKDKVKFLGFVKNTPKFLNQIDIFALTPTRREAFGIAAAEASACGKPVVTTNISGLTEVVENNKTGLVVENKNIEQISSALVKLVGDENLRQEMGASGQRRVEKYFTVEKMVGKFEEVFVK